MDLEKTRAAIPKLPDELWLNVGMYMSTASWRNMAMSCRRFRRLFCMKELFRIIPRESAEWITKRLIELYCTRPLECLEKSWWQNMSPEGFAALMDVVIKCLANNGSMSLRFRFVKTRCEDRMISFLVNEKERISTEHQAAVNTRKQAQSEFQRRSIDSKIKKTWKRMRFLSKHIQVMSRERKDRIRLNKNRAARVDRLERLGLIPHSK